MLSIFSGSRGPDGPDLPSPFGRKVPHKPWSDEPAHKLRSGFVGVDVPYGSDHKCHGGSQLQV